MSQDAVPQDELRWDGILRPGNANCPGCGMSIGLQWLAQALGEPGPCLINVPIGAVHNVYPMVPPGAANHTMIEGENHVSAQR